MKKLFILLLFFISSAYAETTLIIPFSPGGSYDTVGRRFATFLENEINDKVIVVNVTGAGGLIAIHKLNSNSNYIMLTSSSFYVNVIDNQLDLDQFKFISILAESPLYLGVKKNSGITCSTITHPSKDIFLGTSGPGSMSSVATEIVSSKYKHITAVPYKGTGQMITDILSGQISGTFYNSMPDRADIDIIASTTVNAIHGIPGMKECFKLSSSLKTHFILIGNKKIDPDLIKKINLSAIKYIKNSKIIEEFKSQGMIPTASSLEDTTIEVKNEFNFWLNRSNP
jgi:tripartite-type tricarboxylate transporter receptor subunit TctC